MTETEKFKELYITSGEICERLNVSRSSLMSAKRRGLLPGAVNSRSGRGLIWSREKVGPYLDAWEITLKAKRGQLTEI